MTEPAATAGASGQNLPVLELRNEHVWVELDLRYGGAITGLGEAGGPSIVNTHDPGRLIQPALYDGRLDYPINDPNLPDLAWNPVPGGDRRGILTGALDWRWTPGGIHVRSRPREWNGSGPSDVLYSVDVTLEGPAVRYAWRFTNLTEQWRWAKEQELPAVYTVRALDHLVGYVGARPWTGEEALVRPLQETESVFTENWAALVDGEGRGLTVWSPRGDTRFRSYVHQDERTREPAADPTGYVGIFGMADLPPRGSLEGVVYLLAGDWRAGRAWMRARADERPRRWAVAAYEPWSMFGLSGPSEPDPATGRWRLSWAGPASVYLPPGGWAAQPGDTLEITAAFGGTPAPVRVRYHREDGIAWYDGCEGIVQAIFDGQQRTYAASLSGAACYRGYIRQAALVVDAPAGNAGWMELQEIRLNR